MPRIAVDLTPLRPGGENGGAKVLVLELLSEFVRLTPEYDFLLLTADWNHEELADLEGPKVTRLCVLSADGARGEGAAGGVGQLLHAVSRGALRRLPLQVAVPLRRRAVQLARRLPRMLGPVITGMHGPPLLRKHGVALLFCPFTAPTYAEPTIQVVSVVHDLQHRAYPQFFDPLEVAHRDEVVEQVQFWADAVVCVSEYTRQALLTSVGLAPERTWTVHNCVHGRLHRLVPAPDALRDLQFGERPYMFYPANFWAHKNHRMLLTAYGIAVHGNPDTVPHLVFTGAPSEHEEELRRAVDLMGLGPRIHFLGYVSHEALASIFQHCEFLILPSLYEGFGIPVLEAFTFSKPVLCSNVTSLPEVAEDAALYFDPRQPRQIANAIERITTDSELAARLVRRGHRRLAEFGNSRQIAERYLAIFRHVMVAPRRVSEGLRGVYPDGWTGDRVTILHGAGRGPGYLETVFEAPLHLPHDRLWVVVSDSKGETETHTIKRGQSATITRPLSGDTGFVEFLIEPTFQPSAQGDSDDVRTLGCLCRGCWLVSQHGRESLVESLRVT